MLPTDQQSNTTLRGKFTLTCPHCGQVTLRNLVECPFCGFRLDILDKVFGAIPVHRGWVNDCLSTFSKRDLRRLSSYLQQMHERFPQSTFVIFTTKTALDKPLLTQAFWLFNRAKICAPTSRLGRNFSVLLLLLPSKMEAAITVGYGLEALFSREELAQILECGREDFVRQEFGLGCLKILRCLNDKMRQASLRVSKKAL